MRLFSTSLLLAVSSALTGFAFARLAPESAIYSAPSKQALNLRQDAGLNSALTSMKPRSDFAIRQSFNDLQKTLDLQDQQVVEDLQSQLEAFRDGFLSHMESILADQIKLTLASKKDYLTTEEKNGLITLLHQSWTQALHEDLENWRKTELAAWIQNAQQLWVGREEDMNERIEAFKDAYHPSFVRSGYS
jgi:hypothetical protein